MVLSWKIKEMLLVALTTHSLFGFAVIPATWTFLVLILIKNRTWNVFGPKAVQTVLVKKSQAQRVSKCLLMKLSQESSFRLGDGSIPFLIRIFFMAVADRLEISSFFSSALILL